MSSGAGNSRSLRALCAILRDLGGAVWTSSVTAAVSAVGKREDWRVGRKRSILRPRCSIGMRWPR